MTIKTKIIASNPVAYYRMDDTTTTAFDSGGYNHDGTYSGGYTQVPGLSFDGSMGTDFDGIDGLLTMPTGVATVLSGNQEIAIFCIIEPDTLPTWVAGPAEIAAIYYSNQAQFIFYDDGVDDGLFFHIPGITTIGTDAPNWPMSNFTPGQRYILCGTYNAVAGTAELFVDIGRVDLQTGLGGNIPTDSNTGGIGCDTGLLYPFDGTIDEIAVIDNLGDERDFRQQRILANGGWDDSFEYVLSSLDNLEAYYICNEASGSTVFDYSGLSRHISDDTNMSDYGNTPMGTLPDLTLGFNNLEYAHHNTNYFNGLAKPVTLHAIIKIRNISGADRCIFTTNDRVPLGANDGYYAGLTLMFESSTDQFVLIMGDGTGDSTSDRQTGTTSPIVVQGQWYHLVAVWYDKSDMRFYIDGVRDTLETYSGTTTATEADYSTDGPSIARHRHQGSSAIKYMRGDVAHVAVFNDELTQSEVTDLFNAINVVAIRQYEEALTAAGLLTASASGLSDPQIIESLISSDSISNVVEMTLEISAMFNATTQVASTLSAFLVSALLANDAATSDGSFTVTAEAIFNAADTITAAITLVFSDSANFTDALSTERVALLVDLATLVDSTTSQLDAMNLVTVALTLQDAIDRSMGAEVVDAADFNDQIASLLRTNADLVAAAVATASTENTCVVTVPLAVTADLDDAIETNAVLTSLLEDEVEFTIGINFGDDSYIAYVVNTDTAALSTYTNHPFNSLAQIGTGFYGAADGGLFKLAGDDDAGTDIQARILSGLLDFGTALIKRVESADIGYTSDGTLVLKASSVVGGEKRERWYRLKPQTSSGFRDGVVKLAKGPKARYWQFELENIDGADFELADLKLYPMVLTRRR